MKLAVSVGSMDNAASGFNAASQYPQRQHPRPSLSLPSSFLARRFSPTSRACVVPGWKLLSLGRAPAVVASFGMSTPPTFLSSSNSSQSQLSAVPGNTSSPPSLAHDTELPSFQFPGVPTSLRSFLDELVLKVQEAVGEELLPSNTPRDVRRFNAPGPGGLNEGFVIIHKGTDKVKRVLVSWLLCHLPVGAAFGKATLTVFMSEATDAPHLVLEFTFSGTLGPVGQEFPPLTFSKMFAAMDLLPRKDPVMHPDYLKRIYEDTGIDALRLPLMKNDLVQPYTPPTLYMRALFSPAALCFSATLPPNNMHSADLVDIFKPAANKVTDVWVDCVNSLGQSVETDEHKELQARDAMYSKNGTEADLARNLPMLFGEDVTKRVVAAIEV